MLLEEQSRLFFEVQAYTVMERNGNMSRHSATREQPAGIQHHSAASHTTVTCTSYIHRTFDNPLPFSAHSIPYRVFDSNDTADVPVAPTRRSAPDISPSIYMYIYTHTHIYMWGGVTGRVLVWGRMMCDRRE